MASSKADTEHFDVIIIGGGMAGVSTAYHLMTQPPTSNPGISVCIVEARNRLGGRIHAMELSSKTVELGANWIHGMIGNPICDLALKHKLVDPLAYEANPSVEAVQGKRYFVSAVTENGERIPLSLVEETYNTYFWLMKQAESYYAMTDKVDGKDPPAQFCNSVGLSLIHDIQKHLETRDPGDFIPIRKGIFKNLLYRECCISGAHTIEDVSLRDFGAYEELPGGNLTVEGGYISIINLLLDQIDAKIEEITKKSLLCPAIDVKLSHEVTKIQWKGVSSKGDQQQKQDFVRIICSNGVELTASHVISCLPLGVLKEEADRIFDPPLPEYKQTAIQALGFSVVDKVFLEFKNKLTPKFLDPSVNEFLLIWSNEEEDDGDRNNNASPSPDASSKVKKIKLKSNSPAKWWRTIYSFSRVSEYALVGWLSGKEAHHVETLDSVETGKILTEEVFRKFFHPEFPEPESVFVTKWKEDKYSRGSYTFITKNSSVQDIERLSQPIYSDPGQDKPILLFAGESCHPNFFSTVHGAFLSGKKAVSYLMDVEESSATTVQSKKI